MVHLTNSYLAFFNTTNFFLIISRYNPLEVKNKPKMATITDAEVAIKCRTLTVFSVMSNSNQDLIKPPNTSTSILGRTYQNIAAEIINQNPFNNGRDFSYVVLHSLHL